MCCAATIPPGRGNTWVEPELVVEVRYREWTDDGMRYYLVSDIDFSELNELARLMRTHRGE